MCIRDSHTGDPSIYGCIREQMDELEKRKIPFDLCPGVSSFCGAAASLQAEYTLPGISQSVILTRVEGRTAVPEGERLRRLAASGATLVLFLSAGMAEKVKEELLEAGLPKDTPAAVVYKACLLYTSFALITDTSCARSALFRIRRAYTRE